MTFHVRHAATGDYDMTLFWTTFDSHSVLPWIIAVGIAVVAFWITRRNLPELRDAWNSANTAPGVRV